MSKISIRQIDFPVVLAQSGSMAGSASISGSMATDGYSTLVGYVWMSSSTVAGSGVRVSQSYDGVNWDFHSDGAVATATGSAASAITLYAPYVRVFLKVGATNSGSVRSVWRLRAV